MPFTVKKPKAIDTSSLDKLGESVRDLAKYTERELAQVASSMQATEPDQIWNKAPPKPRAGTTAYADGTNWNPGSGKGPYSFDGTNWNPMAPPATAAIIPTGSVMCFWMAAAPVGWTKLTTQNDKALRVVSGSGGVAGGTNAFSTVMAQTTTGNHTLVISETPSHNHPGSNGPVQGNYYSAGGSLLGTPPYGLNNTSQLANAFTVVVATQGGDGPHNHPLTMAMQYIDVILASKN